MAKNDKKDAATPEIQKLAMIILAAGKGTRMKSRKAKVLHSAGGAPLIAHVLRAARTLSPDVTIVVGHQADKGRELTAEWANYADGRVLSGKEAYDLGFVDELGNFEDAVKRAKKLTGLSGDVNLIQYQPRYDLTDLLRMFGKSEGKPATVKVDLGIDPPKLQVGQLYFLTPTFVH